MNGMVLHNKLFIKSCEAWFIISFQSPAPLPAQLPAPTACVPQPQPTGTLPGKMWKLLCRLHEQNWTPPKEWIINHGKNGVFEIKYSINATF